jgi:hypothetical protein
VGWCVGRWRFCDFYGGMDVNFDIFKALRVNWITEGYKQYFDIGAAVLSEIALEVLQIFNKLICSS